MLELFDASPEYERFNSVYDMTRSIPTLGDWKAHFKIPSRAIATAEASQGSSLRARGMKRRRESSDDALFLRDSDEDMTRDEVARNRRSSNQSRSKSQGDHSSIERGHTPPRPSNIARGVARQQYEQSPFVGKQHSDPKIPAANVLPTLIKVEPGTEASRSSVAEDGPDAIAG